MKALEGWKILNLDDLVFIDLECLNESTPRDFSFYYIDIAAASEGKLTLPSITTLFREAPSRARKIVHRHDVLMSTVRPNLKAFAYFDHTDEDCIASTGFAVLTAKKETYPRFILYAILSENVSRQIEALVIGSNYPAINSSAVRGLEILTPPFPEQTKIAEILSTVDRAIEQTEALIAKHQRIKTGLMQDLLTRGIDEHGNLRSEHTHTFKDSPLGRIPMEWEVEELGRNAFVTKLAGFEFTNYFDYKAGGEIIALRALNIKNEQLDLSDIQLISKDVSDKLLRSKIFADDILITYIGAYIGDVLRIEESDKYHLAPNIAKVVAGKALTPRFLEIFLRSPKIRTQIGSLTATTATPSLTMTQIRKLLLFIPSSKDEQNEIALRINSISKALNAAQARAVKLRSLKTALMQDLLTGKKRVTSLLAQEATH